MLSHYTSVESMVCIIGNNSFFMTDYRFLNDPLEQSFGKHIIRSYLEYFADEVGLKKHEYFLDWDFINTILYDDQIYTEDQRQFLTSFCKSHDKLEQWGHYGNKANGVSLVFEDSIKELFQSEKSLSGDVTYIEDEKEAFMSLLADQLDFNIAEFTESLIRNNESKMRNTIAFLRFILSKTIFIKPRHYQSEEEYRFIAPTPSKKK